MIFGIAATLLLVPLSEAFVNAGAPDGSWYQTIGDVLKQLKLLGLTELSLPLLALGGTIFCWQLFRFGLVPRLISLVGLVGYALMFFAGIASWFDLAGGQDNTAVQFKLYRKPFANAGCILP